MTFLNFLFSSKKLDSNEFKDTLETLYCDIKKVKPNNKALKKTQNKEKLLSIQLLNYMIRF